MKRQSTERLVLIALITALAVAGSTFISFPLGVARAYPIQHAINVFAAITMGTGPAVLIAFLAALVRIVLGTGSLLAFPGGMIGALLAGLAYRWTKKKGFALCGEMIGTGLIASLFAVPYAKLLMGTEFGALFFIPGFLLSSVTGAFLGIWLTSLLQRTRIPTQLGRLFKS